MKGVGRERLRIGERRFAAQDVRAPQCQTSVCLPDIMNNRLHAEMIGNEIGVPITQTFGMPCDETESDDRQADNHRCRNTSPERREPSCRLSTRT